MEAAWPSTRLRHALAWLRRGAAMVGLMNLGFLTIFGADVAGRFRVQGGVG